MTKESLATRSMGAYQSWLGKWGLDIVKHWEMSVFK